MRQPLDRSCRVVASTDQLTAMLGDEAVILGTRDDVYYGLDRVGARIWDLVQEPRLLDDVADVIAAEFAVERERALADLLALAGELVDRGLLDVQPPATA
jgi:hypothetical protein